MKNPRTPNVQWQGPGWRIEAQDQLWIEAPIDEAWTAAYQLVAQRGRLVIGAMRIIPAEPRRPASAFGAWSGDRLGLRAGAVVPLGGITSTLRNKIRVGAHVDAIPKIWKKIQAAYGTDADADAWFRQQTGAEPPSVRPAGRRGRHPPTPDRELLRFATAYAAAVKTQTRSPIQQVATRLRTNPQTVRRRIHQARLRGFLTVTQQGVRSGALTDRARVLLNQAKRRRP